MEEVIYCFWTGYNEMSENRKKCIEQLIHDSECKVILVTPHNLNDYILPEHPLHPGYEFLSETHKADYLRTYFMNFHGGGYSDIKKPSGSWKNAFVELNNRANDWICGYPEIEGGAACGDWRELVGTPAFICKPNTPLTNEWYNEMITLLDRKLEELRLHPARFPQDCREVSNYPIEWNEMLGRIFHKVCTTYKHHLLRILPMPICNDYR